MKKLFTKRPCVSQKKPHSRTVYALIGKKRQQIGKTLPIRGSENPEVPISWLVTVDTFAFLAKGVSRCTGTILLPCRKSSQGFEVCYVGCQLLSLPKDGSQDISKVCYTGIICFFIAKDAPCCTGNIFASYAGRAVRGGYRGLTRTSYFFANNKRSFFSNSGGILHSYTNRNSTVNSPTKSHFGGFERFQFETSTLVGQGEAQTRLRQP